MKNVPNHQPDNANLYDFHKIMSDIYGELLDIYGNDGTWMDL